MRKDMRHFILLIICLSLSACIGVNKTRQNMIVYDFGLTVPGKNQQLITLKIPVEEISTAEALNHSKMRYRLNYQNPARIFSYSESRWASTPSELLASRLSTLSSLAPLANDTPLQNPNNKSANCSLKLKIETFDHVFQSASISEGIVQLNASLIEKKSKQIITNQLITASVSSATPDAQGGAGALQKASENALRAALNWGNMMSEKNNLCESK
jgi:ABC-type uncharacterized transport system auxiliary subunit